MAETNVTTPIAVQVPPQVAVQPEVAPAVEPKKEEPQTAAAPVVVGQPTEAQGKKLNIVA